WWFALVVNGVFYFLIGLALGKLWGWTGAVPSRPAPEAGSGYSRRRFLRTGLKVVGTGAVVGLGYALAVEPRWFQVTLCVLSIRDLPNALHGLRLVQLTDIHHGPWLELSYVRQVVEATNQLEPDLILLTGDYVHYSPEYIRPVIGELARLRARV